MIRMEQTINNGWGLCDLHSHILPGIDDGCQSPEESRKVLELCRRQGVSHMAATPHYHAERGLDAFLERRRRAWAQLRQTMAGQECPRIVLGAEVAYYPGLLQEDRIEKLCLGCSNYLLLEMPFSPWTPSMLRNVRSLRHTQGVILILAHVERYASMQDKRILNEVLDSGALLQMNGEYLLDPRTRRRALKLIRQGVVDVLGSDCHGFEHRPPNLAEAWERLESGRLAGHARRIEETMQEIFEEAE